MLVRDARSSDLSLLVDFVMAEASEAEQLVLERDPVMRAVGAALTDHALARYWIVEDGGDAVGAIAVVREWSDWRNTAYWWIQFVFVVPAARGKGVLARLVAHVVAQAAEARAPELRLYVNPENVRAVRAYERLGFVPSAYRIMTLPVAADPAAAESAEQPDLDDDALWAAFHDRTLPARGWTHAAHLRVAWLYLARHALDEAHVLMRVGIIRLNSAHGLVETARRGYHETLTRVWLAIVAAARARDAGIDSRAFLTTHALGRDLPLRHYSRERLFSVEARACLVAPDLEELPALRVH